MGALVTETISTWSCDECAFTMDACHTDEPGGGYTCPCCEVRALTAERDTLREALEVIETMHPGYWGGPNTTLTWEDTAGFMKMRARSALSTEKEKP